MKHSAFNNAKDILAHASHAQPCIVSSTRSDPVPSQGMLISCEVDDSATLSLLKAAIMRIHPDAKLVIATSQPGVILCFPPQFTSLPIQQISIQLRKLERDVAECIRRDDDGSYTITRDATMHPLDLFDLIDTIAGQYYQREYHRLKQLGKTAEEIEKFDATPHFSTPKGEVFLDEEDGMRYTKLDGRQVRYFMRQRQEQGKIAYDVGALLDHVTLGPIAAQEVLNTLGLMPQGLQRFEIN